MNKLTGKGLAAFALSKLGVPYVYGAKGADGVFTEAKLNWLAKNYPSNFTKTYIAKAKKLIGKVCCDCSGLISWYTGRLYGSSQLYKVAIVKQPISTLSEAPVGAVLWKNGHVGVYIGGGYCVEEKGIDYGCVKSMVSNTKFTHWLLFDFIDYEAKVVAYSKNINPYPVPTRTIFYDAELPIMNGDDVAWVQFELKEAGFKITVDKKFGPASNKALIAFQTSCKIEADGKCGGITRRELIENK